MGGGGWNGWTHWNACNGNEATIARLFNDLARRIFGAMEFKDGASLVADLTTKGRKTGLPRTVELRFIYFKGSFYASSARVAGKHWCQNMIKNPAVEISAKGEKLSCLAKQLTDDTLRRQILALRDSPPRLERVVFEITPGK